MELKKRTYFEYELIGGRSLPTGKCFKLYYPLTIMAALALMLSLRAGLALASSTLPAPGINPDGGSFTMPTMVNIFDDAAGDPIYFTTDNSDPETSSTATLYTAPFYVSQSETVSAGVYDPVFGWSSVTSVAFSIQIPSLIQAPVISPDGGSFPAAQTVTISGIPAGDTCYYTTNGDYPGTSDTPYTVPFTVGQSEKIEAIIYIPSAGYSAVTAATFYINGASLVQAPVISPDGGTFTTPQTVKISNTDDCFYTTDGSDPETSKTAEVYVSPFEMWSGTVNAANDDPSNGWSSVTTATFTLSGETPPVTPTISPDGGSFTSSQTVTISNIPSGDICYYTTDGSNPNDNQASRTSYTGPFTVSQTETVEAANWNAASGWSTDALANFVIGDSVASLTITPNGGVFPAPQSVTITGIPAGDTCCYTTDGSNPTTSSTAVPYTG